MFNNGVSLADIAAVTNKNDGAFGGEGGWWVLIILFALFGGWGGNGFGGGGGRMFGDYGQFATAASQQEILFGQRFQGLDNKIDRIGNGIADATFALNNTIQNGFSSAELSRANSQASLVGVLNNMAMTEQKCCCDTQRAIENGFANTNYNLATQACATNTQIGNSTRDIIDSQNANTRAILDALNEQQLATKDAKIADLTAEVGKLQLAASQSAQNNYIVSQLRMPTPVPAYSVPNPFASYGCGYGCGCNA